MKQIGFVPSEKFARLAVPKSEAIRDSPEIGFVLFESGQQSAINLWKGFKGKEF
jgi:hypothetical protein